MMFPRYLAVVLFMVWVSPSAVQPRPPCGADVNNIKPAYAEVSALPRVQVWQQIDLTDAAACLGSVRGPMELVVVLSGRFQGPVSPRHLAAHIGAISSSEGLVYWSTTEGRWRTLITESFALDGPDGQRRRDFTATEILRDRTLYFGQNDTRSTGQNVYSLTARRPTPEQLVVEIVNQTKIQFTFVPIFDVADLRSVHVMTHLSDDIWGYYGVFAVRAGAGEDYQKSLINRAAAFYRHLIGVPPDRMPPLAP